MTVGTEKNDKHASSDSQYTSQDTNQAPPKYKTHALPLQPASSVLSISPRTL